MASNDLVTTEDRYATWPRIPIAVLLGVSLAALIAISVAIVIVYMGLQARRIIGDQITSTGKQRIERLRDAAENRLDETERTSRAVLAATSEISDAGGRAAAMLAILETRDEKVRLRIGGLTGFRDEDGKVTVTETDETPGTQTGWSVDDDGALTYTIAPAGSGDPLFSMTVFGRKISRDLVAAGDTGFAVPFLLAGRTTVIGHANWAQSGAPGGTAVPLETAEDRDLRNIWTRTEERHNLPTELNAHLDRGAEQLRVYVYEDIKRPHIALTVGFHVAARDYGAGFDQNKTAVIAAAGALVAGVLAAILMSFWLGRPIRRLAMARAADRGSVAGYRSEAPALTHARTRRCQWSFCLCL